MWRIVKLRRAVGAFDGEGARLHEGRWNSRGTRMVYTASTWSLALLEVLVHLDTAGPLEAYVVIEATFDDALVETLDDPPPNWREQPAPRETRQIGDAWVAGARSAVLSVPSTISPVERTYLLNPAHPDFRRIRRGVVQPVHVDPRLKARLARA